MSKVIRFCYFLIVCYILIGCTIKNSSSTVSERQPPTYKSEFPAAECPYYTGVLAQNSIGSKYIPEAKTWIDWSEDINNWHYHGRDREAKPEEIEIYKLDQEINNEVTTRDEADFFRWEKEKLETQYHDQLVTLEKRDTEHYKQKIQTLIEESKQK